MADDEPTEDPERQELRERVDDIIDSTYFESPESAEKTYAKLTDETDLSMAKPYTIDVELAENDTVDHPEFGIGFVLDLVSPTKVEVLFEDGEHIRLVCNQKSKG